MACGARGVARVALALLCTSAALGELLDLSHTYDNTTLYWDEQDTFTLTKLDPVPGQLWSDKNRLATVERAGTHMTAPSHFNPEGWSVESIPAERFIANAAVIDLSEKAQADPDALLTVADLDAWRDAHGEFKYPTVLLVKTGYAAYWPDRARYFGESADHPGVKHLPGLDEELARELADDPAVVGVGSDSASLDSGVTGYLPTHVMLSRANKFVLENLGDLSRVPATGSRIYAMPMKIGGGNAAPTRVLIELDAMACRKGRGQKGKGRGRKGQGRGQKGRGGEGQGRGGEGQGRGGEGQGRGGEGRGQRGPGRGGEGRGQRRRGQGRRGQAQAEPEPEPTDY